MKVRTIKRFVYLLLAITAAGFSTFTNAQDPSLRQIGGGAGITVFRDRNFQGNASTFTNDVPNLANVGFNNSISSFRVGPGEQWLMCDLPNYAGQCINVSGEERDLRNNGWDNRASSLRRISGGGGIPPTPPGTGSLILYTRTNYRGNTRTYNRSTPNLLTFNRRAASARVNFGNWQVCEGTNFTGRCVVLSQSTRDLADFGMRNRISSVRPVGGMPPQPPPPSGVQITLFPQQNYLGAPTVFVSANPNTFTQTRSATVQAGSWQLCDGANYTGRCIVLNQSVWDFSNYNIGRTIRSIRPN
jgi:hypothetical protein